VNLSGSVLQGSSFAGRDLSGARLGPDPETGTSPAPDQAA
jgi:uncharacterized protein YjbI with pentapeptide repeats